MKPAQFAPVMKDLVVLLLAMAIAFPSMAQDDEKKKKSGKKGMNIGERMGKITGDLLTSKTADLKLAVAKPIYYCGVFPMDVGTTAAKMIPEGTVEGDHVVSISFMKNEGAGMYKIKGDVNFNGEPMEYLGLGSYMASSPEPFKENPKIEITTEAGDKASFVMKIIPEIKLLKVNGESSLPVVDIAEDLDIEIFNPPGAEKTRIKVSLLSGVMGVRFFNHFADFESGPEGVRKIKIPKQALANPETIGQLGAGNYNKGENTLLIERMLVIEDDKLGPEQNKGNFHSAQLTTVSCSTMPVILKGKAEGGFNLSLKVTGHTNDTGFDFFKPNATTGIPLSQASSFGLTSFSLNGTTFREVSTSSTSYGYVGGGYGTRTTITTYTFQFPQLPDAHWEYLMEEFYTAMVKLFKDKYQIDFVPVEAVTGTTQYKTLFKTEDVNTKDVIKKSYKNTLRSDPRSLTEILGSVSSNTTSNVPVVNMMKEANVDGLVSVSLTLTVGGNKDDKVVLSPALRVSIIGRDEKNNSKQGTYLVGMIRGPGVPFNSDAVKSDKKAFVNACSLPQLIDGLDQALSTLKKKEGELGYDAIWSIGK